MVGAKEWAESTSKTPTGFGSAYIFTRPYPSAQINDWSLEFNLTYLGNSTSAERIAYGFTVACSEICDTGERSGVGAHPFCGKAAACPWPPSIYRRP